MPDNKKIVLHVGCGFQNPERTPKVFQNSNWQEVRVDIDPKVKPDIITSVIDLSYFESNSIDAVYSSHNLEHLHSHEVKIALKEFVRVLKPEGFAIVTLPDIQQIATLIAKGELDSVLYTSKVGPISPIDMIFGHRASIEQGNLFMAHKTGFTSKSLGNIMYHSGFSEVRINKGKFYDLWAVAIKSESDSHNDFFNWLNTQGYII